jgi:hypothetical protein
MAPRRGSKVALMEAACLNAAVFGLEVEIRAERDLLDRLEDRLPFSWRRCRPRRVDRRYHIVRDDAAPRTLELRGDDALLARSANADALCEHFESDLELFVAIHARTHTIVHAGVVGWRGRAIVIPGRSFSGKTSLTAAQEPIKIEPKLIQMRADAKMSAEQLKNTRLTGAQDLVWALVNNPAFLFNH